MPQPALDRSPLLASRLPLLPESQHSLWACYADPVMVTVLPVPIDILRQSLREELHMAAPDD